MAVLGTRLAALAALVLVTLAPALAENGFFPSVSDLPLLEGFTEDQNETLVFDSPEGRIAVAVAAGPGEADKVRTLYVASLTQLGWQPVEGDETGTFTRDGELLTLSVTRGFDPGQIRLEISLAPVAVEPH